MCRLRIQPFPVGKIAVKAVCRNVLYTLHCILRAELTKNVLLQTVFSRFCPLGNNNKKSAVHMITEHFELGCSLLIIHLLIIHILLQSNFSIQRI